MAVVTMILIFSSAISTVVLLFKKHDPNGRNVDVVRQTLLLNGELAICTPQRRHLYGVYSTAYSEERQKSRHPGTCSLYCHGAPVSVNDLTKRTHTISRPSLREAFITVVQKSEPPILLSRYVLEGGTMVPIIVLSIPQLFGV